MFLGHFGLAFAARHVSPRTSLATTFVAAQLADLLWPLFLLLGWETVSIAPNANPFLTLDFTRYPWSHSLAMGVVWGVVLGVLYFVITRNARGAIVVGVLVPSHWVLDFLSHVPDLPLYPGGSARLGLGLWKAPAATIVVEVAVFFTAVILYARVTDARDRVGRYGLWALAVFLVLMYVASAVGPPPPNVRVLALTALIGWPLTLFPWWVDRHRAPRVRRQG